MGDVGKEFPSRPRTGTEFIVNARTVAMYLLLPLGRVDDAVEQGRLAENSDPLASYVHAHLAYVLISAHRFDEAAAHCAKVPPSEKVLGQCVGRIMLGQGRIEEAIRFFTANPDPTDPGGFLGHALGRAGRRDDAEKLAAGTTRPVHSGSDLCGSRRQGAHAPSARSHDGVGPRSGRQNPHFSGTRSDSRRSARESYSKEGRFNGIAPQGYLYAPVGRRMNPTLDLPGASKVVLETRAIGRHDPRLLIGSLDISQALPPGLTTRVAFVKALRMLFVEVTLGSISLT